MGGGCCAEREVGCSWWWAGEGKGEGEGEGDDEVPFPILFRRATSAVSANPWSVEAATVRIFQLRTVLKSGSNGWID